MTTEQKALAIIEAIVASCQLVDGNRCANGISFYSDWGGNSLTVYTDGSHAHVGQPYHSLAEFVDQLHAQLVEGWGLTRVAK